ncbi:hypothetical protein BKA70DRAFT_1488715 [Coprinopsis sp. MPI-PUGE-AT-0042]|nr:hypothetical protein BKA70DRAFT_1488715 [Coprinopsis sp. MPI-PUGE-AT-0042]
MKSVAWQMHLRAKDIISGYVHSQLLRNKKSITQKQRRKYKGRQGAKSVGSGMAKTKISALVAEASAASSKLKGIFGEKTMHQVVLELQDEVRRCGKHLAKLQEPQEHVKATMAAVNTVQQEISVAHNNIYEASGIQKEWRIPRSDESLRRTVGRQHGWNSGIIPKKAPRFEILRKVYKAQTWRNQPTLVASEILGDASCTPDSTLRPLASDLTELAVSWIDKTWHTEVVAGETHRNSYETSEDVIHHSFHQKLRIVGDKFKDFDEEILGATAAIIDPRGDPYHYLDPVLRLVKAYYDHGIPVHSPASWDSKGCITSFSYLDSPLNSEGAQDAEELCSRELLYSALGLRVQQLSAFGLGDRPDVSGVYSQQRCLALPCMFNSHYNIRDSIVEYEVDLCNKLHEETPELWLFLEDLACSVSECEVNVPGSTSDDFAEATEDSGSADIASDVEGSALNNAAEGGSQCWRRSCQGQSSPERSYKDSEAEVVSWEAHTGVKASFGKQGD